MTKRVAHIKRIYKNNDSTSDTWIDVERIDELWLVSSGAQRSHWIFDWEVFNEQASTKKEIADPNDPTNKIEVPIRTKIRVTTPKSASNHSFINNETNESRETHSRKIYHHEIKPAYLTDGEPPSDPEQYFDSLGEQDKTQFVEVEILDHYWTAEDEAFDWWRHRRKFSFKKQKKKWIPATTDPLLQEPLKPTDSSDPTFVAVRNPAAGPKVDPPWRLDPLQNIVNVSWGGGGAVFISADSAAFARRLEMENKSSTADWSDLGPLQFTENGNIVGSSYKKVGAAEDGSGGAPTFVLVGQDDGGATGDEAGIIMASSDGSAWTRVYIFEGGAVGEGNISAMMLGVVWNKTDNCFYAGANIHELIPAEEEGGDIVIKHYDVLFKSSGGYAWSEEGRNETAGDININGLLAQKCSGVKFNESITVPVLDADGHAVPDGVYGFDERRKILIVPSVPPTIHYGFGNVVVNSVSTVEKTTVGPDGGTITTTVNVGIPVACVAYAGGIWMAAGGSTAAAAAYSVDDGKTWTSTTPGGGSEIDASTHTICAAPRKDLEAS